MGNKFQFEFIDDYYWLYAYCTSSTYSIYIHSSGSLIIIHSEITFCLTKMQFNLVRNYSIYLYSSTVHRHIPPFLTRHHLGYPMDFTQVTWFIGSPPWIFYNFEFDLSLFVTNIHISISRLQNVFITLLNLFVMVLLDCMANTLPLPCVDPSLHPPTSHPPNYNIKLNTSAGNDYFLLLCISGRENNGT